MPRLTEQRRRDRMPRVRTLGALSAITGLVLVTVPLTANADESERVLITTTISDDVASAPLGMSMAKGAPEPEKAMDFLNWVISPEAQTIIAQGYFRPVITEGVPAEVLGRFPAVERQVTINIAHAAAHVADLKRAFTDAVLRGGDIDAALGQIGLAGS